MTLREVFTVSFLVFAAVASVSCGDEPAEPQPEVGTGPPAAGQDGAQCLDDGDCFGGVCLTELENGLPNGYCTSFGCTPGSCNGGACVVDKWGNAACVDTCVDGNDCREGYSCEERGGASLCDFTSDTTDEVGESPGATCLRGCEAGDPFRIECGYTPSRRFEGEALDGGDLLQWGLDYRLTQGISGFVLSIWPDPAALEDPKEDEEEEEPPHFAVNALSIRNDGGERLNLKAAEAALNVSSFSDSDMVALPFPYAPAYEAFVEGNGGLLQVQSQAPQLCIARAEGRQGDEIEVHIYLVGADGLTADLLGSDPDFQQAVETLQEILALSGVTIAHFVPHAVDPDDVERYRIIRNEEALGEVLALTEDPGARVGADSADSLVLNLVLVDDILPTDSGDTVGRAGLLPGPAGVHGTAYSGVVAEASSLRDAPDYLGVIVAHEFGHFLGLRHTTELFEIELPFGTVDPLVDTPTCPDPRAQGESCPDYNNLMFPLASPDRSTSRITLTADQSFVLRNNPLVR